jgi:3-hydroxybutyryl-CoA dehydrogenase
MQIVVLADERSKAELTSGGVDSGANIVWIKEPEEFLLHKNADAFIDLLFVHEQERVNLLQNLLPRPVIINSVVATLSATDNSFIRINGWFTFLRSPLIEASAATERRKEAEAILSIFKKQVEWLPDEAGFVSARVVSMIINEAHHALAEGVSTREEIDTAMQLGTNYPYGPFRWAKEIGTNHVRSLLNTLAKQQPHYKPSSLL